MKSVDKKANPGLAKLPTTVRNKMGYMKKGGEAMATKKSTTADRKGRAMMPGKMSKNLPMIAAQSAYKDGGDAKKASAYDKMQDKKMAAHASKPAKVAHKRMGGMMKKSGCK
jgi:hypothetical protein